jgi:hypothetical protein
MEQKHPGHLTSKKNLKNDERLITLRLKIIEDLKKIKSDNLLVTRSGCCPVPFPLQVMFHLCYFSEKSTVNTDFTQTHLCHIR